MRELVRKREHLRRLAIAAVDEDERRIVVAEGEAAEFGDAQLAMHVVPDHAVDDD